jgi:hypothetical protein
MRAIWGRMSEEPSGGQHRMVLPRAALGAAVRRILGRRGASHDVQGSDPLRRFPDADHVFAGEPVPLPREIDQTVFGPASVSASRSNPLPDVRHRRRAVQECLGGSPDSGPRFLLFTLSHCLYLGLGAGALCPASFFRVEEGELPRPGSTAPLMPSLTAGAGIACRGTVNPGGVAPGKLCTGAPAEPL